MKILQLGLFLMSLSAHRAVDASISQIPNEDIKAGQDLRKQLLNNYDKVVVPSTRKKLVQMKMTVIFNSVDLEWIDERLTWNPNDFDKINYMVFEYREIWHPDLMAYKNIEAQTPAYGYTQSLINSTGNVVHVQPVRYRINYRSDMTDWPYDVQTGVLKVGSWVYGGNTINLTDVSYEIEVVSSHTEWQIVRVSSEKITKFYPCCPGEPYDYAEFNFTIDRKTYRRHPVVFLPASTVALLNLLVFWLQPDDKCKLITSLFNVLIVALILLVVYSKIPLTLTSVPLIVSYYIYTLGLIALTAIISVLVKNMTQTHEPLSKPFKSFVQSKFIELFRMGTNKPKPTDNQTEYENNETDTQNMEFNKRMVLAKIIDKICFFVFLLIYVFLLSALYFKFLKRQEFFFQYY